MGFVYALAPSASQICNLQGPVTPHLFCSLLTLAHPGAGPGWSIKANSSTTGTADQTCSKQSLLWILKNSYFQNHPLSYPHETEADLGGPASVRQCDNGIWLPPSSRAEGQRRESPARRVMGLKSHLSDSAKGPCEDRGVVRGAELSHRVWGKGLSAHSDLQGWRERGRGSTF